LVNLCSLQYGQTKDVLVRMSIPDDKPYLSVTLKYEPRNSKKQVEYNVEGISRDGGDEVDVQRFRLLFVDNVRLAMQLMKENKAPEAEELIKKLMKNVQTTSKDKISLALLEDLRGQVMEAIANKASYEKWGVHYLPSLMRAHLLQQCNNFKDPGIQHYGGNLFRTLRDEVDDIFCKLPPPKPSKGGKHTPVQSMRSYNSSANPCFDGECLVRMADGSQKSVNLVVKGDRVMTPNNNSAEVMCVVKTICQDQKAKLVELEGGLIVTPYHPVRVNGKWYFPCDLGKVIERSCVAVYSFVLKDEHVMLINDIQCVTLGHNFNDEVVQHSYFGSNRVIEDLQKKRGWNSGLIQFNSGCMIRNLKTGLVCGFHDVVSEESW